MTYLIIQRGFPLFSCHIPVFDLKYRQQTGHIIEIAKRLFVKISRFFQWRSRGSGEMNLKTTAMISCLSLVALLVISYFKFNRNDVSERSRQNREPLLSPFERKQPTHFFERK